MKAVAFNLKKIRRKAIILKITLQYRMKGYPYYICERWGRKVFFDLEGNNGISRSQKKWAHSKGFLSTSIEKYNLNEQNCNLFFSDFEYTFITPINNQYEKWLTDRLTPYLIFKPVKREALPEVYYSIIRRNGVQKIIELKSNQCVNVNSVIELLKEKKDLILLPSQSSYSKYSYLFQFRNNTFYVNNKKISKTNIERMFCNLTSFYLIRERIETKQSIKELFDDREVTFKFIIARKSSETATILSSCIQFDRPYIGGRDTNKRFRYKNLRQIIVNEKTGGYTWKNQGRVRGIGAIPEWEKICHTVIGFAEFIPEIDYMMLAIKITDTGIKLVGHGRMPQMPEGISDQSDLNLFLKDISDKKYHQITHKNELKTLCKNRALNIMAHKVFRKGFRPYMINVWLNTVKDDFFSASMPLKKKIWAWKHGFPSFRIEQYGLTKDNCNQILSDYEYAWLNRINNTYQKWINDKTSMRYVLDCVKEYLPEYYFFVGNQWNGLKIRKLQDCPKNISNSIEGIIDLLRMKKKIVFKPNAGLHGDGFYKIECHDGNIFVNDNSVSDDEFRSLLQHQKSTYVITDYIEMHPQLKKIYDKSVNTIRIMVMNNECDSPKIMQTYMRVGTSKTGVTDNIAFGGIAVHVNPLNGHYYDAELLKNHQYLKIKKHPDTGTLLEGVLPNWDHIKDGVLKVSKQIPQLEYLGFDIAITKNGFKILEINIHQDLHKACEFTKDMNKFFAEKIEYKKRLYHI